MVKTDADGKVAYELDFYDFGSILRNMTIEQRRHARTPIKMIVRIQFENGKSIDVETWDISDGGLGIQIEKDDNVVWSLHMPIKAQVQGLPIEGPILPMRAVRITEDRIGFQLTKSSA